MKIYDISQELFSSKVYPGDKAPERVLVSDMTKGASCNVSELSMNAHNGTHMDAPRHFVKDGITIDELDLNRLIGRCTVITAEGEIGPELIRALDAKRVLFRGDCHLTKEAADILSECGIFLVGVESQSIATYDDPITVHVSVLSRGIAALEGLVLTDVPDGEYFLFAAPIKLGGSDGSPCRAVLIDSIDTEN
ncbi:MAG: cyclase family protein [Eubacteriales bacterium]